MSAGPRLTRITTRSGDDGTTGLGDGQRVPKTASRVHALGEVDELNSHLGVLLAEPMPHDVRLTLTRIQHELFDLGGELSIPGATLLQEQALLTLDDEIARFNAPLGPLAEFILPAGNRPASLCHVARTVARRAERSVLVLDAEDDSHVSRQARLYLNRLSDLLFILARTLNRSPLSADGEAPGDVPWKRHDLR